ncbi:MAG: leucine-rich repeat domain-containing protein, partial [Odoribacter sp.]
FTLADGTTKITLPRYIAFQIGGDNSTEVLPITGATDIALVLPATFKESDYSAIKSEIKTNSGISTNIKTRAATLNLLWKVEVIKPTFTGGVCNNDAKIKVTPIVEDLGGNAVLKVTIINSNGNELTSIRAIKFIGTVVSNAGGELSTKILTPGDVKYLTVTGTMTADDFTFVRASMTAIECLDLSGTDLTTIPLKALAFDAKMGLTTNYTLKKIILPQGVTTIGNSAFAMCAALESIEFPQSVTTLGSSMFKGCEKLNEITIPSGVTAIPEDGFYKMEGLQSIIIPGTVQTIGKWAFGSCSNLSSVTIQDGVTTIFDNAFSFCSSLKSITIPQTVTSIGVEVFSSNSNLETAIINANVTSLTATFLKCTNLKNVTFPSTLTTIGHITFSECSSLEEIELPINIKEIGEKAFFSCRKLREVITRPSLEKLGEAAFVSCESLLGFSIPDKVTIIPKDLFAHCRRLKHVGIYGRVTSIGEAAFWGCAIKSIMLPETVTSIGRVAFTGCTDLTTIVCDATSVPTATNAFDVINQLNNRGVVLLVPAAQVSDYQTAWGSYFPTGIEAK